MKHARSIHHLFLLVSLLATADPGELQAQDETARSYPTRLLLNNIAEVGPGCSVNASLGTTVFNTRSDYFIGEFSIGIAGVSELGLTNTGLASNLLALRRPIGSWELTVRLLRSREHLPDISLAVRGPLKWNHDDLLPQDIQTEKPVLFEQGLRGVRYDFRITTASVLFSKPLSRSLRLHGEIGIQQAQWRDLWIFLDPIPPGIDPNGYHAPELEHELLVQGYVGSEWHLNSRFTVIGELQSLPHFKPDIQMLALSLRRSYIGTIGLRTLLVAPVTLDLSLRYHRGPDGLTSTQLAVGLNGLMSIR